MTPPIEEPTDDEVFEQRCLWISAQLAAAEEDCVSGILADFLGENARLHADRMYARLEAMGAHDLALACVLLFNDRAGQEANRLWSQLCTTAPKDVKA